MGKLLYYEPQAAEPIHNLHKIQDDHPQKDKGSNPSRAMCSLTKHQVNIKPHSDSEETSLFSLHQVERQSLPVQDLALQSIHSLLYLYEGHEAHPTPMQKDGYNSVSIPQKFPSTRQLVHLSQGRWPENGAVTPETGFCAEPGKVSAGAQTRIYTSGSGVQHTEYDLPLPQENVLAIKTQKTKWVSSTTHRGVMRLLGLTNFASMALPLARLHSHPLQFWLKENCKTPADPFKGLNQAQRHLKPCIGGTPSNHTQNKYPEP